MKKAIPFIIVIALILCIGGGAAWKFFFSKYTPTGEKLDYASALGLEKDEYSVTLNHELLKDKKAVNMDGRVYLDVDLVTDMINTRFYHDSSENLCMYSNASQLMIFTPDQQKYTVRTWDKTGWKDSADGDEGYAVVRSKGGSLYVAADYITANTRMDYGAYTDGGNNRLNIQTSWGEEEKVSTQKKTPVRYKGGIKGQVLRETEPGETMTVLAAYDDWYNVATDDGYIGWVSRKAMGTPEKEQAKAPDFEEAVYQNIHRDHKINMTWHQVMNKDSNDSVKKVIKASPGINVLSPTWFYLSDTEGGVASTAGRDYVSVCHKEGIEVWALFSNEFPSGTDRVFDAAKTDQVLGSTSKRAKVIENIMTYAGDSGIDGINLDFELISQEGADDYVEFVRELSVACRANGLVFSVDNYVPVYTSYYNRREQGIVADYVVTMCYDETPAGSDTPGPVASENFFTTGVTDTLKLVDKSKVIAGIPFFTRVWSTSKDGKVTSFACGMDEAQSYLDKHGVKAQTQESTGLEYGSYTSDVDGAAYEIWLQNESSVKNEMNVVKENDLAGCASWKAGFESGKTIWKIIAHRLK